MPLDHGGNIRTHGLVSLAAGAGHEILLVIPAGGAAVSIAGVTVVELTSRSGPGRSVAKILSRHPLRSPRVRRRSLRSARQVVRGFAPEIAVVSESMAWSLASLIVPRDIPLVYDAHNAEAVLFRSLREQADSFLSRITLAVDARRVALGENELIARSAAVLAVSLADARYFSRAPAQVHLVPSSVPTPEVDGGEAVQPACLFVGTLDYPPNRAAAEELVGAVWPLVRAQVPQATLEVVGRRAPTELRSLVASTPGVTLREDIADLGPTYRAVRCVVLPIRSGGGSRLKVYEALAYGVPVVATPGAVSGGLEEAPGIRLADSSEDLAAHAVVVLQNDGVARALAVEGRRFFLEHLTWEGVPRVALLAALASLAPGEG